MRAALPELLPAIPGSVLHSEVHAATTFDGVSTNSQTVQPGELFVALRGERFDGHDFLAEVLSRGAAAVVVDQLPPGFPLPALQVPDTRYALGQIARAWRQRFSLPVVAVTGSNGKTTVKEMIAAIFAARYGAANYLATRGNLNNEIGVPLTLLRLDSQHRAAVIELGMNHPGEIARLAEIAAPTVAIVNNAQREHQEFMASVEAVAEENGAVILALPSEGCAVFPADDIYSSLWQGYAADRRQMSFGLSPTAPVHCTWRPLAFGNHMEVSASGESFAFELAAAGEHNVRNALAACAAALALGIEGRSIALGLESFTPVAGRLQKKAGMHGALVIDDTYNANPDSVRAAIAVLAAAPAPRCLVLGDMGEVGTEGVAFHEEIGAYAREQQLDQLFTLGTLARHTGLAFGSGAHHFEDMDSLNNEMNRLPSGASVLVKGSRFMQMERVVQHLTATPAEGH